MAKSKAKSVADKRYEKFCSIENLQLAWNRIYANSEDIGYKNLYRALFTYYDYDADENLKRLSERLKNRSYKPSKSFKFYKPKQSGLQRMFSLLDIEDLIVYQALANIIVPDFAKKREPLERTFIFSHLFNKEYKDNIFLFEKWKIGYQAYKNNIAKNFNAGLKITAHFDLAAYYDTIDHNSLLNSSFKEKDESGNTGIRKQLEECLERWSNKSDDSLKQHHHGIPQGPMSSAIFGELFLSPIDKFLEKNKITYSRYVDDFVIQGKTLEEVQKAIVLLEIKCKEYGLVPQVGKFEITESKSVEDAIGKAPSLSNQEKENVFSSPEETLSLVNKAFLKESFDSSKIRYILKVYQNSSILLDVVFQEFRNHYEFVEEFCIYLKRFIVSDIDLIYPFVKDQILKTVPYEFVEYELWMLLAEISENFDCSELGEYAVRQLKSCKSFAKFGIYTFLSTLNDNRFISYLSHETEVTMMLFAIPLINSNVVENEKFGDLLSYYARRSSEILKIVLSRHLYNLRLFRKISQEKLEECLVVLPKVDEVSYKTINFYLKEDFGIDSKIKWDDFLGDGYQQACALLYNAHITQKANLSRQVNLFNLPRNIL
ncbi:MULTISPECIES: RNA-directed DNA polymerase [unclassified Fibrobacter]|uniref:RNA-directed DNA polymerase n=1 Tax=unclassified Fibrobacter TaxID=2634177 RepID=UPI000D6ABCCE|nr:MULTISPECIES: RNA-directed DNA polymerase [unclassified Fibrobacter]PWJ58125.1 reverse transcriptase (RNA-dependent DNA polymerase) [Fibrobacter sp. UWR4]PZW62826.1 reverse transcriptase (RNA-dependent DNA polymerase) [Fibrobacter sp. UWR1]